MNKEGTKKFHGYIGRTVWVAESKFGFGHTYSLNITRSKNDKEAYEVLNKVANHMGTMKQVVSTLCWVPIIKKSYEGVEYISINCTSKTPLEKGKYYQFMIDINKSKQSINCSIRDVTPFYLETKVDKQQTLAEFLNEK